MQHPLPSTAAANGPTVANGPTAVTSSATGLIPEPRPVSGGPDLTKPPYSATAGKKVDPFTGITSEQLAFGLQIWKIVKTVAAAATDVKASIGYVPFVLQAKITSVNFAIFNHLKTMYRE